MALCSSYCSAISTAIRESFVPHAIAWTYSIYLYLVPKRGSVLNLKNRTIPIINLPENNRPLLPVTSAFATTDSDQIEQLRCAMYLLSQLYYSSFITNTRLQVGRKPNHLARSSSLLPTKEITRSNHVYMHC